MLMSVTVRLEDRRKTGARNTTHGNLIVCAVVHGVHLNGDGDECYDGAYARFAYARSYRFAYERCASFGVCHPHDVLVLLVLVLLPTLLYLYSTMNHSIP